jgi:hypothetical protein
MERGYLLQADSLGNPVRDARARVVLEFFPPPEPGQSIEAGKGEIVRQILPSRLARHPEDGPEWHHCPSCRLLHYPSSPTPP